MTEARWPFGTEQAVVVGGGIAGMLAARVLVDFCPQVTVVERDTLPEQPLFRQGVPQSRHAHQLLLGGLALLEELFPGLRAELLAAGAVPVEVPRDIASYTPDGWAPRYRSGMVALYCSRELLEWQLRQRLIRFPQVTVRQGWAAAGLEMDGAGVTGVRLRARGETQGAGVRLPAGLVVDASGRGSRAGRWLEALGYSAPEETVINPFLGYASRTYAAPTARYFNWKMLYIPTLAPFLLRSGAIFPLEGNRWLVTLAGAGRDYPPTDEAGFLEFARSLASPALVEALQKGEAISPIYGFQRSENRLRHFERLARMPEGFVALGDAVAVFNPVYGQGMASAARGARALRDCLTTPAEGAFSLRFQRKLSEQQRLPWLMATAQDFRYETTEGSRPSLPTRLAQGYINEVAVLAQEHRHVSRAFLQVTHLLEPASTLLRPSILALVLWRVSRQRPWGRVRADALRVGSGV